MSDEPVRKRRKSSQKKQEEVQLASVRRAVRLALLRAEKSAAKAERTRLHAANQDGEACLSSPASLNGIVSPAVAADPPADQSEDRLPAEPDGPPRAGTDAAPDTTPPGAPPPSGAPSGPPSPLSAGREGRDRSTSARPHALKRPAAAGGDAGGEVADAAADGGPAVEVDLEALKRLYPEIVEDEVNKYERNRQKRVTAKQRLEEKEDAADDVKRKVKELADMIRHARYVVIHTGAGVSTSAAIPDYRGPQGVYKGTKNYTQLMAGEDWKALETAEPTTTHKLIAALYRDGIIQHVCTQNVDSLHVKSGLPLRALTELHGNVFVEECERCGATHRRHFIVNPASRRNFHKTGRTCDRVSKKTGGLACGGDLKDTVVYRGERLNAKVMAVARQHSQSADLSIVLGSSLITPPASTLPLLAKKRGGQLAIVNLQWTCRDKNASLKIHAKCDVVSELLAKELHINLTEPAAPPKPKSDRPRQPRIRKPKPPPEPSSPRRPPALLDAPLIIDGPRLRRRTAKAAASSLPSSPSEHDERADALRETGNPVTHEHGFDMQVPGTLTTGKEAGEGTFTPHAVQQFYPAVTTAQQPFDPYAFYMYQYQMYGNMYMQAYQAYYRPGVST